ncbi:MAG: hypothetical protein WCS98_06625 [Bacillota bacterium]|nr:hypothetical protein [Bacillota bacterium]MDD3298674.1 hypothetical protein [Bacillota bacterium]MDD4708175.1 hypothetical protein [Bacillota bacterium]
MGKDNKPTDEQLEELFQAASDFKKGQPWKELYDTDLLCVENPKDKTMGYCSVMGRAGEHYALGVYLGNEGIFGFNQLLEYADTIPTHQVLHYQNCIMCSFEDRSQLSNKDRRQIKALGLSFRGRNAWPMFRRFEPGYHPWYVNKDECAFLTHALRQTLYVITNEMTDEVKRDMEQGKTILRYSEEINDKLEWYSKEFQLAIPEVTYSPVIINDDMLIHKIKRAGNMANVTLQADICYMTSAVQENRNERPYYPRIYILIEKETGMVMDFEMYESINDDADVMLNRLIDMFLENGIPKEIQIKGRAMEAILGDFCKKAGIKLKAVKSLSGIDQILREVDQRF